MTRFSHLNVPDQWNNYWSKYPNGYTILEALLNWVKQVDDLTDNVNSWNDYLDDFVKRFDKELQKEVVALLNEWYANGLLAKIINNEVLGMKADQQTVNVLRFGADPTGKTSSLQAVLAAVATLKEGDTLEFPKGEYDLKGGIIPINVQWITIKGAGKLIIDLGFRPSKSHFHVDGSDGLRLVCPAWSSEARAFKIDNIPVEGSPISYLYDFQFRNVYMEGFFYSVSAIGGTYEVNGNEQAQGYPIRDFIVEGCESRTWTDYNAGHFQAIQVENVSYINNRTYGGKNATSYNAIKGNGFLKVIGNYDENNSYGSCEIENASGRAIVTGNTFKKKIWIDDSFDCIVSNNVCLDTIHITVGSDNGDAKNVIVANNTAKNIRAEQFGVYKGGMIRNLSIVNNIVTGDNIHAIWVHGNAVVRGLIAGNQITGTNTNDISVQRSSTVTTLELIIRGNIGAGATLLISGTGGKVYAWDNYNMSASGNRDQFPESHVEKEFNGVRINSDGAAYRLNITADGVPYTVKY